MAKEELNLVEEEIDQLASTILLQMIEKDDAVILILFLNFFFGLY